MFGESPYNSNSKDNEDLFEKLTYLSKYGMKAAAFISLYDIMLFSHPKGVAPTIVRVLVWGSRCVIPLATFASLTYVFSNLNPPESHNKGYFNYGASGAISGAIFGALTQSVKRSLGCGLFGAFSSIVVKDSLIYDYKLFSIDTNDIDSPTDKTLYVKRSKLQIE